MLIVVKDRTIIVTAIPRITDDFHSLGDIGWYGSAYLITGSSFILTFGKVYTFYSPKWVFLFAITVFEIGSAICGAAPNSLAFIVGRAIAGLGSSGIFSGAIIISVPLLPLQKRAMVQGFFGAVFGIASVVGPLLGGVFTDDVSWRWNFYINLPLGAVTILIIVLILKLPKNQKKEKLTIRERIGQLDIIGTLLLLPSMICLLLALQWGGSVYAWNSARIIALLVLFALLFITFVAVQIWKQDTATVPPRIFKQRSIMAGLFFVFCSASAMMSLVYFIPIWFQAIQGVSAVESGIRMLPMILSLVLASMLAGVFVSKVGYYTPLLYVCSIAMSIGAGLITTFSLTTTEGQWIGYQIIFGLGLGTGMQMPSLAAQAVLAKADVPTGTSLMMFTQTLAGALFISVSQNIFTNFLVAGLADVPGFNPAIIVNAGATDLRGHVPPDLLDVVLTAYNSALSRTYYVPTAMAALAIFGAIGMEWTSVKGKGNGVPGGPQEPKTDSAQAAAPIPSVDPVTSVEKI
jgi:EmrB/QacA subfamily drug resistance transporter